MKELPLYQCKICSAQYGTRELAEECEKSHKIIKQVKYRSMKSNPDGYPDSVWITFNDDRSVRYIRGLE